jgi:chromate transporter
MTDAPTTVHGAVPMTSTADHGVTFGEAARVWARIAALSFGGPSLRFATTGRGCGR